MKKTILLALLFALSNTISAQLDIKIEDLPPVKNPQPRTMYSTKKMIINGTYHGKNLFVRNPFGKRGIGFCVTQVNVNGNITTDEINASIFQIALDVHTLKADDKFKLEIFFKDSSDVPILMNPGAIMLPDPSGINELVFEGKNISTNLIATNPRSSKGKYGLKEVLVNGKKVAGIDADVFEIPFYDMGFKYEEKVKIQFKYETGCDPFVINPEVINY